MERIRIERIEDIDFSNKLVIRALGRAYKNLLKSTERDQSPANKPISKGKRLTATHND